MEVVFQKEVNTAPRDKIEPVASVLGCAPTQWNLLLFAKKLLYEAINATNNAKMNDDQMNVIDDSLRKVFYAFLASLFLCIFIEEILSYSWQFRTSHFILKQTLSFFLFLFILFCDHLPKLFLVISNNQKIVGYLDFSFHHHMI